MVSTATPIWFVIFAAVRSHGLVAPSPHLLVVDGGDEMNIQSVESIPSPTPVSCTLRKDGEKCKKEEQCCSQVCESKKCVGSNVPRGFSSVNKNGECKKKGSGEPFLPCKKNKECCSNTCIKLPKMKKKDKKESYCGFFVLEVISPSPTMSSQPSQYPSPEPSNAPSSSPSLKPSRSPSSRPSSFPSFFPSSHPSQQPSLYPSSRPSFFPSSHPSQQPSLYPTSEPSQFPSFKPSSPPSRSPAPSAVPSSEPSTSPSSAPSMLCRFRMSGERCDRKVECCTQVCTNSKCVGNDLPQGYSPVNKDGKCKRKGFKPPFEFCEEDDECCNGRCILLKNPREKRCGFYVLDENDI